MHNQNKKAMLIIYRLTLNLGIKLNDYATRIAKL